jgi:hypothetical protein
MSLQGQSLPGVFVEVVIRFQLDKPAEDSQLGVHHASFQPAI